MRFLSLPLVVAKVASVKFPRLLRPAENRAERSRRGNSTSATSATTLLLLVAAPLLAGCPNTDTAVFVDPSIDAPAMTVQSSPLGTGLTGSFTLGLHLGARASGPSMVSIGQFTIQDAQKKGDIVSPLALDSGATQFPVTVEQDGDVNVALTFDTGTKLLPADVGPKLCDAAGVIITGTIQDSLQNTATPVESAVVKPSGCM